MTYSQAQLEAYLDEDLDAGMMSNIEVALREDTQLLNSLSTILSQRLLSTLIAPFAKELIENFLNK